MYFSIFENSISIFSNKNQISSSKRQSRVCSPAIKKSFNTEIDKGHFKYLVFRNEESQTPSSAEKNNTIQGKCESFFGSHRNSIENQVASIFNSCSAEKTPENSVKKKEIKAKTKKDSFKNFIFNAKQSKFTIPRIEKNLSISISRIKMNKKIPAFPCNKDFNLKAKTRDFPIRLDHFIKNRSNFINNYSIRKKRSSTPNDCKKVKKNLKVKRKNSPQIFSVIPSPLKDFSDFE